MFLLDSVSQVSVRTMMFMANWETTNSVSSSLLAIDLTFARRTDGKWLLSNSPILRFPMGEASDVVGPVVIKEVF